MQIRSLTWYAFLLAPSEGNANLNCGLVHISPLKNAGKLGVFSAKPSSGFFLPPYVEVARPNLDLVRVSPRKKRRELSFFFALPGKKNEFEFRHYTHVATKRRRRVPGAFFRRNRPWFFVGALWRKCAFEVRLGTHFAAKTTNESLFFFGCETVRFFFKRPLKKMRIRIATWNTSGRENPPRMPGGFSAKPSLFF